MEALSTYDTIGNVWETRAESGLETLAYSQLVVVLENVLFAVYVTTAGSTPQEPVLIVPGCGAGAYAADYYRDSCEPCPVGTYSGAVLTRDVRLWEF